MNWQSTQWNEGLTLHQTANGFVFEVPLDNGHVNSIQSNIKPLALGQTISLSYEVKKISGRPNFVALDGEGPANFSVMIAETPTTGRWYAAGAPESVCVDLDAAIDRGQQTWSIKLKPAKWQDVNGQQIGAAFKRALPKCRIVQVVYGGKFRAHGVRVLGGEAQFELIKFAIK